MTEQIDMSRFIEAKSDQLNADDLIGAPRTITITRVTGSDGDQPISIFYQGDNNKPFRPCKTIRRVLMGVWGRYANEYVGRSMTIYRDDKVTFGGLETGGIRISHMSHIDKETVVVVMKSKGKKAGVKILPLKAQQSTQQRQTPAQWLDNYLAEIAAVPVLDALASLQMRSQKALAKLATDHPELHERAVAAMADRHEQLSNPAAAEKRDDPDMGDPFDGDDFADTRNEGEE